MATSPFSLKWHILPLLDRYVLSHLLTALAALTSGAVALIWLTQSLHFVSMIVQHGLSIRAFIHLTSLMLPSFMSVILPVTTFLGVLFVYQRLIGDRELTVMRAIGLSPFKLARPGLLCAFLSTGLCYFLSLWLAPTSYHAFHHYEYEIRNSIVAFLLDEGVFTPVSPTMMIYVRHHNADNEFYGIVIQDSRNPASPVTILAERGTLIPGDNAPHLVLLHGSRQEIDLHNNQLSMLNFDQDTIELNNSHSSKTAGEDVAELPLHALFHPSSTMPSRFRNKLIVEGWQRITSPLATLSYSIIGLVCVLRGRFSRHGNITRPFFAVLGVTGLLTLSLMLKSMAEHNLFIIPLLWSETLLPGLIGLGLLLLDQFKGSRIRYSATRPKK